MWEIINERNLTKSKIAGIIGYSKGQTGWVLDNKAPLTDRFIKVFASEFNISEHWLKTGEEPMRSNDITLSEDPAIQDKLEKARAVLQSDTRHAETLSNNIEDYFRLLEMDKEEDPKAEGTNNLAGR